MAKPPEKINPLSDAETRKGQKIFTRLKKRFDETARQVFDPVTCPAPVPDPYLKPDKQKSKIIARVIGAHQIEDMRSMGSFRPFVERSTPS